MSTSSPSIRRKALRAVCVGVGGLLTFLVLDLAGLPASAATQVEQASVPLSSVSSTSPVSLAQFDPADGTLQQVTVTVSVAASTDVDITNLTPAAKSTSVTIESTASVSGPGVTTLAVSPTGSQSQSLASGATFTFGVDASGSQQQVITAPADLAAFIGAGTVTYNVTGLVGVDVQGPATWRASGGLDGTATVQIEYQFNHAPVAVADSTTVVEDSGASAIDVLANDTDADGGAIAVGAVTQPTNGEVVITGGGSGLTYQPDANYCNSQVGGSPDTFSYTLTPGASSATVSVTVTCVDDGPTAADDTTTVVEDDAATAIDVLANDTDVDGGPLAIASASDPANGTVALTGGLPGAHTGLTYQPDPNYCNDPPGTTPDAFTYTLNGGSTATVTVTVTCVDDPPVAVNDAVTVSEDASATALAVLANDFDDGLGSVTIASASDPANGTVVLTGGLPGAHTGLTYQPDPNYCSATPDTFTYTLNGGSTATVSVTVTCVDDAPVAVDDSATISEDSGANAIDVLANDTDIDAGPTTIISASDPANGTVVITGDGSGLTYEPDVHYCNTQPGGSPDTFTYELNGGDTATVSITVTCIDDPPTAVNDSAIVGEDSAPSAIDVLANDTDVDGGPRAIASVTQPANGTVVITGGGSGLTYQPNPNYCNTQPGGSPDTFTYELNGGSTATVSVTVTCVDDPPTAVGDAATVGEDSAASAIDVLANDTDIDGGPLAIASASDPANGAVVLTGGSPGAHTGLTYQPDPNYCNNPPGTTPDTFTYTLNGGSTATVSVTVTCVDDAPVAVDDAATVLQNSGANTIDVLANDTDIDGGLEAIASASDPANGTVVLTGGSPGAHTGLTYQPDPNYCNDDPGGTPDTFTYSLNGGSTATVSVTVNCDVPPVAVNDSAIVSEDAAAMAIDVLANDTDVDGGPKTINTASDPANGTVVLTGGSPGAHTGLTYQPDPNYCNSPPGTTPDTFTYMLNGGATATVSVAVTCVDDPPTAVNDSATVSEDAAATAVAVLANDTDVDGGPTTISSASDPANGTVVLTGGSPGAHTGLTYQPDPNYCNNPPGTTPDTFTYMLNGGATATVSVTVTCTPDNPVVDTSAGSTSYTENAAATPIDPAVTVSDPDVGTVITGATVQITGNFAGSEDVLALAGVHPLITAMQAGDTLTLSGSASPAEYQAALRDVTYGNTSENPSTAGRTVTFTVTDDTARSGSDTKAITVIAVDDPPTAVADSTTLLEDPGATAIAVLTNDTDIDGGPKTIASATDPAHGTVALTGGSPGAHTGLTYQPDANYCNNPPGTTPDTFSYTLNGGSSAQVSITVTCVNDAPIATTQAFDVLTNMRRTITVALSGAGGPTDPDSGDPGYTPTFTLASVTLPGVGCAGCVLENINLAAATFDFEPPAGQTGSFTVNYTVTDSGNPAPGLTSAAGTLTMNVAGPTIWFVNPTAASNGTGTLAHPFQALAGVAGTPNDADDVDAANHRVFVYSNGTAAGSLALNSGEWLIGQAANPGQTFDQFFGLGTIPAGTLARPALNTGTTTLSGTITLATNARVQGVNISTGAGAAMIGLAGTTGVDVSQAALTTTTGTTLSLNNVAGTITLSDLDKNGAGTGISMTLGSAAVTVPSGATIAATTTAAVDIDGGTGAFSYAGTITNASGRTVEVTNRNGVTPGLVQFTGSITSTGGTGVNLDNNDTGTITFSGGLVLSTGTSAAFNAINGGTVNVTDPNAVGTAPDNTITTTTGTALNVNGTNIGAADLNFRSISSTDAASGIALNTTGSAGGLTITGNGGTCTSAATCTGGAIQSSTGTGVSLTGVPGGVSLTRIFVSGSADDGIGGSGVAGFALDNATVTGNGNTPNAVGGGVHGDHGVDFANLTGTVTFTSSNVSNNIDSNVVVSNSSGILNMSVTGGAYSGATGGMGDGIFVEGTGSGSQNLNVQGPITFANNVGDAVQHGSSPGNTTDSDVTINNATITSPPAPGGGPFCANSILGGGITVSEGGPTSGGGSNFDVVITNNNIQNSCIGAIAVGTTGSVGDQQIANVDLTIQNNIIGTAGVAGSGSVQGNGIFVDSNGNSVVRALITNNTIRQWTNRSGIALDVLDGDAEMSATIRGNLLTEPHSAPIGTSTRGMTIQLGAAQVGDSIDACLDIGGAAALQNTLTDTGESPQPDVRYLHEGPNSAVQLAGFAGTANQTDISNWFISRNVFGPTPTISGIFSATGSTTSNVASCPLPTP